MKWTPDDFERNDVVFYVDGTEGEKRKEYDRQRKEYFEQKEYQRLQAIHNEKQKITKLKERIQYSDHLVQEICDRISAGELMINICNDVHMPTMKIVNEWLKAHPDFSALHQIATQNRLSIFEEEVIQIADDATLDWKEISIKGKAKKQIDPEIIARAKLRIEVRFRHLKAGKPQKWGDSSTLITRSADDEFDPANMSTEELEKRIADIEAKSR